MRLLWRLGRFKKDGCSGTRALASEYMDGRLGREERTRVEEHLAACPRCRAELESLRATVALLHGLPEVAPARRFVVAPVRPLPGRRALPALRFATASVVVLLVAALAVDQADLFVREPDSGRYTADTVQWGPGEAYWTVDGVRNSVDSDAETPARLVVPDGTDNACAAVESLSTNGVVYGSVKADSADLTQVVLQEGGDQNVAGGEVEELAVVSAPDGISMALAVSDGQRPSELDPVIESRAGSYLNMVSADYSALYSFDLNSSERVTAPAPGNDNWMRLPEYGLIGLAALLGAAAAGVWLWRRRARLAEVKVDRG
jgi:hypothetical protein